MRKRYIFVISAVGITLIMLFSYGDIRYEPQSGTEGLSFSLDPGRLAPSYASDISLRVAVSVDERTYEALREATEQFMSERSNVKVELANISAEMLNVHYRALADMGEGPDILLVPTQHIRPEAAGGRLIALDNYITAERQSQWFEPVRGAVRWNGYVWGVPFDWDPYVFVYRPDPVFAERRSVSDWLTAGEYASAGEAANDAYGARLLEQGMVLETVAEESASSEGDVVPPEADQAAEEKRQPEFGNDAQKTAETKGSDILDPLLPLAKLQRGEADWAFARLGEAIDALRISGSEWQAAAYIPDEGAALAVLPPFSGRSFAVPASSRHPQEAAEWIRYITESFEEIGRTQRWPVLRSSFGISPPPTGIGTAVRTGGFTLPSPAGKTEEELLFALRPLMQAVDAHPPALSPPQPLPREFASE